jgi:hypothetical protein
MQAPPPNTRIRLRRGACVHVCRVVGMKGRTWRITAPLLRSEVIPLRPSDSFLADFTTEQGVASFFTRVLGRAPGDEPMLTIEAPSSVTINERRGAERISFIPGIPARIGKFAEAEVRDVSARGALVHCNVPIQPGMRTTLSMRGMEAEGLALSCEEAGSKVWPGYKVRLLFEQRLSANDLSSLQPSANR